MSEFAKARALFVNAIFDALEVLTGEEVVGVLTVDDDEALTPWICRADKELRRTVEDSITVSAWNASKSL